MIQPRLLVSIGDLVEDVVVWAAGPTVLATDNPSSISRSRGGSAANVARFASTQGPARFIGRVGDDALGRSLTEDLVEAGVDVRVQRLGRTGSVVIIVDEDGERTMYPDRGAAAELADVPPDWAAGAGVLHAPAYCFAQPGSLATTVDLLHRGRQQGALISLDAASVSVLHEIGVSAYLELVRTLAPDVLFANTPEAACLSIDRGAWAGPIRPGTVVVKDGARPVLVYGADGGVTAVPVPQVDAVLDTTGAGDAFAAGYLCAALRGQGPAAAAANGGALAVSVLTEPGARVAGPQPRGLSTSTTPGSGRIRAG